MQMFREHGQKKKYYHDVVGWNARMDGIQAAVLRVKLKYLDRATEGRRRAAALYQELLGDVSEVVLPGEAAYGRHVYHVYAIRVQGRDEIMKQLGERGIATGIHYPVPVHLQAAYAGLGHKVGDFPVSEACGNDFLSLPMFPEITSDQVALVATELKNVLAPVVANA
jgi:dTDP-4-amino-4,6-dideoxygalactose transaminase